MEMEMADALHAHKEKISALLGRQAFYGDEAEIEVFYEYPRASETKVALKAGLATLKNAGYQAEIARGKLLVSLKNVGDTWNARYVAA